MVGNIPTELKLYAEERFVIGPVVDRDFWSGKRASMAIDRGPCELTRLHLKCAYSMLRSEWRETRTGLFDSDS